MSSLPAIKKKSKIKLKNSKHNKNQNRQQSTEKIDKAVNTHQEILTIDSQNEGQASLKGKNCEIFNVLIGKLKTFTLKSKTCLKTKKKKIEDVTHEIEKYLRRKKKVEEICF